VLFRSPQNPKTPRALINDNKYGDQENTLNVLKVCLPTSCPRLNCREYFPTELMGQQIDQILD
jgi:hypothetical protein